METAKAYFRFRDDYEHYSTNHRFHSTTRVTLLRLTTSPRTLQEEVEDRLLAEYGSGIQLAESFLVVLVVVLVVLVVTLRVVVVASHYCYRESHHRDHHNHHHDHQNHYQDHQDHPGARFRGCQLKVVSIFLDGRDGRTPPDHPGRTDGQKKLGKAYFSYVFQFVLSCSLFFSNVFLAFS